MDNVKAAAETMAQLLTNNPAIRAAWLNYVAAAADRYAALEGRVSDLQRNVASLRSDIDSAIDSSVRRALEGTELRVMGLGALVDAMNAQSEQMGLLAERMGQVETQITQRLPVLPAAEEGA